MNAFLKNFQERFITSILLIAVYGTALFALPPIFFSMLVGLTLALALIVEWKNFFPVNSIGFWAVMPFYPILPFLCLIRLGQYSQPVVVLLFATVFSFDVGGYLVGNLIGRNKIWPSVSPGKTWEGFFGGYLFALVAALATFRMYGIALPPLFAVPFILVTCIVAFLGDCFESWLKRRAGIKDSSNLLPGHGGILDRFDGILFAAVLFYGLRTLL